MRNIGRSVHILVLGFCGVFFGYACASGVGPQPFGLFTHSINGVLSAGCVIALCFVWAAVRREGNN